MPIKLSLAGNPNSGKTTMFNTLTGSDQRVGNWPGVTVERKEGKLKGNADVIVQDLPGIYSLSPYTLEEVVSRNYLITEQPDVIINIVDATNIERNLYLTTQLTELGIPVVIALNMFDDLTRRGDKVDFEKLGKLLGCTIIPTSAVRNTGCQEAVDKAVSLAGKEFPHIHCFNGDIENALIEIESLLPAIPASRWYAVKLFERDTKAAQTLTLSDDTAKKIEEIIARTVRNGCSPEEIIARERYDFISKAVNASVTKAPAALDPTARIDSIVTNRFLALPIFAAVMFLVYYVSITTIGTMGTDWVNDVLFGEIIPEFVSDLLEKAHTASWLQGLIVEGIIGGVGAVLGFLPQMLVLFLCLSFLEDCGYMSRVAFIMDRVFRSFGLSGKSFIPMLIATGCSVPGIMASRTIENESDRRMTVLTTGFIPCGAKLPVIALIAGALFNNAAWVATSCYLSGIAAVVISGMILKKTRLFAGDPSPFIMELPSYHLPLWSSVLRTTLQRGWSFVRKAATIILLSTVIIWVLQNFNWHFRMVDANDSMLASIGSMLSPLFAPLGWGNWKAVVATLTGLIAKENVVGTLGVLYGVAEAAEDGSEYWDLLRRDYSRLAAYSFLIFNLLCAPCFAAVAAVRREMMSARWTLFALGYQTAFAFITSLLIYQFGKFFISGVFEWQGMVPAIILSGVVLYLLFRKNKFARTQDSNAVELHGEKLK